MTRIRHAFSLATLTLFVAPLPAQDPATDRVRTLNEAAQAQRLTPEELRTDDWHETHAQTLYHLAHALLAVECEDSSRAYYQDRALASFEELAFCAGDGNPLAMHAYVGIADVHAERGAWEDAAHFYRAVAVGLLGEEGTQPRRLEAVPEPELDAPEPMEALDEAVGVGGGSGGRFGQRAPALEAPPEEPEDTSTDLRAHLRAGDLHAREDDWEAAAREYREIVRQLSDGDDER